MRKFLTSFFAAVIALVPLVSSFAMPAAANAATVGLIKGPGDTVYWKSTDGKRYVFPTYNTFRSWYGDISQPIQILTSEELGIIPIGGNVTYKPGVRLIKVTTDPKVYAIARYGVLRWITSESLAVQLYGADWARKVDDLPDPFFVNYNMGASINSTADYSPSGETSAVSTPDDSQKQPASPTSPTPTTPVNTGARFTTTASRTSITSGDLVNLSAVLNSPNTNPAITHFDILDPRTNEPLKTCWNVTSCDVSLNLEIRLGVNSVIFHARGYDASNTKVAEEWFPTISIAQPASSATSSVWTEFGSTNLYRMADGSYTSDQFHVNASDPSGIRKIEMVKNEGVYKTCDFGSAQSGTQTCQVGVYAIDFPVGTVVTVYAKITNGNGAVTRSDSKTFTILNYTSPSGPVAPTITAPYANQVFTNYPRTLTVTWANDNQPRHNVEVACDVCVSVTNLYSNPTTYYASDRMMSYSLPALAGDNTFRVRVQAVDASGVTSPWSNYTYFSFKTAPTSSGPSAPTITSPTANQVFTNYPRTLTVTWANDNQPRHNVEVACDVCVSVTNLYSNPTTYYASDYRMYQALPALAGDNTFRVRVQAVDASGVTSPWSNYTYFSFKTAPSAATLQVTNVLFQDATVNDNLGTKVGLVFNHQPQKVAFSFTSPTGQKILNGYSNVTKLTVTPYSDSYAMLMNNLASNVDYQYLVTATDWDGTTATAQGIYHSPTLTQAYAYLDYQVVGTSQQGQIVVSPVPAGCNSSKCGYNFSSKTYSGYTGGAFYSTNSEGAYRLYGNNVGQGGLAPLANGDVAAPLVSSGQYNRFGVPLTVGSWYAVYDEANQMFIKIHVAKLVTP
ncbi:MAG: hypothetical protein WC551_01360 [Patescibacteria group bacterium]